MPDVNTDYVRYKVLHNSVIVISGETRLCHIHFYAQTNETYQVLLTPINAFLEKEIAGDTVELKITEYLQQNPPSDITNVKCDILNRQIHLSWDACTDIDFHHYMVVCGSLSAPYNIIETTTNEITLPVGVGEHEFHVYAVDFLGNRSINPASASVDITDFFVDNVIIEQSVDLSSGTFTGAICYTSASELRRPSAAGSEVSYPYMETADDCDALTVAINWGGVTADDLTGVTADEFKEIKPTASGVWESEIIDLGNIEEGYCSTYYTVNYIQKTLDDLVLTADKFDGVYPQDFIDNGTIKVTFYTSTDGVKWVQKHMGGYIKARYLKYKVEMNTRNPLYEFRLSNLRFTIDVPDITDGGRVTVTDTQTISYNKLFHHVRAVNFSTIGSTDVDLVSFDNIGFTVTVVGGGSAEISWQAQGY